jgi:gamma-glutamyltranspeptidase/glutathione hydrolase
MISFIQSNYMGFGSGVVVPDWGISLQNRGFGFSMDPKSANVVAGGKRPFQTIIPAFLMRKEENCSVPQKSFGVMGGHGASRPSTNCFKNALVSPATSGGL